MTLNALEVYRAHCGVEAALCVVVFFLAVLTWSATRRHGEPAHKGVKWLYVASALYVIAYLLGTVEYSLGPVQKPQRTYTYMPSTPAIDNAIRLFESQQRLGESALFLRTLGDCALVCCIAGLAAGIYRVNDPNRAHTYYTLIVAFAAVLATLALAVFAGQQSLTTKDIELIRGFDKPDWEYYHDKHLQEDISTLHAACEVMLLICSVAVTATVVLAVAEARKSAGGFRKLSRSVEALVAASLVNIVIHGWAMYTVVQIVRTPKVNYLWFYVVDLVMDRFGTVLALGLLHIVASQKSSGSWWTSQPDPDNISHQMYVSQPYQPRQ